MRIAYALVVGCALAVPALAQPFPARPVRVIVPVPPGGAIDIVARLGAARLAQALGQPFVVENRPGARGAIGAEAVAKAPPDGHTLLVFSDALTIMPFTERKLAFEVPASFAPVSLLATQPLVLAVNPSQPVNSVAELIAVARARPGGVTFGTGALAHYLAGEYFQKRAGFGMAHVPYKGGPAAVTDLVGGQIPVALTGQSPMLPYVRSGRLRAIAVTSKARSAALPEVPTLAESGVAGIDLFEWIFMMAPAGTPKSVVASLNAEIAKALAAPEVQQRLAAGGFEAAPSSPAQLEAMMRDALSRWGELIPKLDIRPE